MMESVQQYQSDTRATYLRQLEADYAQGRLLIYFLKNQSELYTHLLSGTG